MDSNKTPKLRLKYEEFKEKYHIPKSIKDENECPIKIGIYQEQNIKTSQNKNEKKEYVLKKINVMQKKHCAYLKKFISYLDAQSKNIDYILPIENYCIEKKNVKKNDGSFIFYIVHQKENNLKDLIDLKEKKSKKLEESRGLEQLKKMEKSKRVEEINHLEEPTKFQELKELEIWVILREITKIFGSLLEENVFFEYLTALSVKGPSFDNIFITKTQILSAKNNIKPMRKTNMKIDLLKFAEKKQNFNCNKENIYLNDLGRLLNDLLANTQKRNKISVCMKKLKKEFDHYQKVDWKKISLHPILCQNKEEVIDMLYWEIKQKDRNYLKIYKKDSEQENEKSEDQNSENNTPKIKKKKSKKNKYNEENDVEKTATITKFGKKNVDIKDIVNKNEKLKKEEENNTEKKTKDIEKPLENNFEGENDENGGKKPKKTKDNINENKKQKGKEEEREEKTRKIKKKVKKENFSCDFQPRNDNDYNDKNFEEKLLENNSEEENQKIKKSDENGKKKPKKTKENVSENKNLREQEEEIEEKTQKINKKENSSCDFQPCNNNDYNEKNFEEKKEKLLENNSEEENQKIKKSDENGKKKQKKTKENVSENKNLREQEEEIEEKTQKINKKVKKENSSCDFQQNEAKKIKYENSEYADCEFIDRDDSPHAQLNPDERIFCKRILATYRNSYKKENKYFDEFGEWIVSPILMKDLPDEHLKKLHQNFEERPNKSLKRFEHLCNKLKIFEQDDKEKFLRILKMLYTDIK